MWPFLGQLAIAAMPGLASAFGQHQANKQNVQLTREGMAFESDQVAKQMQFQERMSGSSYQRATEDMRLAGINPMLAYAQGGASTPGGGAASGAAATVQDVVGPAVASAQHARRLKADIGLMSEQAQKIRSEEINVRRAGKLQEIEAGIMRRTAHRTQAETMEAYERAREANSRTMLNLADLPGRRVSGQVAGGRFGQVTEYARRLFGSTGGLPALGAGAMLGRFAKPTYNIYRR